MNVSPEYILQQNTLILTAWSMDGNRIRTMAETVIDTGLGGSDS